MLPYVTRRILQGILVIVLISVGTFVVIRLMPGDPTYLLLGEGEIRISAEQMEAIRRRWGLDRPYHEQYLVWAWISCRGDFGDSLIRTGIPCGDDLRVDPEPRSEFPLGAGCWSQSRPHICRRPRNSSFDYTTSVGSTLVWPANTSGWG